MDDLSDMERDVWAGEVPLQLTVLAPVPGPNNNVALPSYLSEINVGMAFPAAGRKE